ncbi:MAG: VWA domain-containing protein [Acidobacteria bacterium]|nr:VWA domain-containing protein [Acidobacteriota bacterium]
MAKRHVLLPLLLLGVFSGGLWLAAQDDTVFRITVDMVQLNVAVTDKKGNYVTGLRPWDFQLTEDGIQQKLATFAEGNETPRHLAEFEPNQFGAPKVVPSSARVSGRLRNDQAIFSDDQQESVTSLIAGASVFILFDTSNYMYKGFVFAQDAIANFVRTLDHPDRVAFYSYSRDFSRAATLTSDRGQVLRGVRATVAGDDAALYNALLLTLKDAAQFSGRKVVVVFSNGPDNASMVAPEDVRELAQSEGIPIYMISTREARLEPVSTAVFERMSASTGGKAYFAKSWQDQQKAFANIRDDLAHVYSVSYYPQTNPNRGWRDIKVKLIGEHLKKYKIRTRNGYRPKAARLAVQSAPPTAMPPSD